MPKATKQLAKKVDAAEESEGFQPVPEGTYTVRLMEVTVGEGPAGPYWTWIYQIPDDAEEYADTRFWNTTSWSDKALGMPGGVKQTFAAFGVPVDTDTDELLGEYVDVYVTQQIQQKGKRAGQKVNQVEEVLPAEDAPDADAGTGKGKAGGKGGGDAEDY